MSVTYKGSAVSKVTYNGSTVRVWTHRGTTVYTAEKNFADVTVPDVNNYRVYNSTASKEATIGDVRGFNRLQFDWRFTTYSGCVNPNMFDSTSTLELVFADGSVVTVGSMRAGLSRSTDTYGTSGSFSTDLSGKSATALASVKIRAKVSDMYAPVPLDSDNCTMRAALTNIRAT